MMIAAAVLASLTACTQDYLDRRDGISLTAGNAIATNKATHIVDPWPRSSGDTNIAFDGQRMQSAVERYRYNAVTPPRGISTSGTYAASNSAPAQTPNIPTPVGQTVTQTTK